MTEPGVEPTSSGCTTGDCTTDLKRSAVMSGTGIHRLIYRDICVAATAHNICHRLTGDWRGAALERTDEEVRGGGDGEAARAPARTTIRVSLYIYIYLCSADGSTHTESNKLYRKVKDRALSNLSSRQRPKRAPIRRRSRRRQRRGEPHTEHGLGVQREFVYVYK